MSDPHEDEGPSHWNYRVRAYTAYTGVPGMDPEECFDIVEVYYDADNNIHGWGNDPGVVAESVESLRGELEKRLEALDKPILTPEELG